MECHSEEGERWSSGLPVDSFPAAYDYFAVFLESFDAPDYKSVLFIEREHLGKALQSSGFLKKALGLVKVPSGLFQVDDEFESRYQDLMNRGYRWLKFNILGVVNENLVVEVIYPHESSGWEPEDCHVNYSLPAVKSKWVPGFLVD